jgi:hypothetical protein
MNRLHDPPNDPIFLAYLDLYMSYRALIAMVARLRVPPDEFAGQVEDWRRAHRTFGTEQTRALVQDAHERFRDSIAHGIAAADCADRAPSG